MNSTLDGMRQNFQIRVRKTATLIQSMKTHVNSTGMIVRAHLLQFIAAAAFGLTSNAWAATIADNFNDGNDNCG